MTLVEMFGVSWQNIKFLRSKYEVFIPFWLQVFSLSNCGSFHKMFVVGGSHAYHIFKLQQDWIRI